MQGSFHSYSVEAAIIDHIYITSRVWVASTKRLSVEKPSWTPMKKLSRIYDSIFRKYATLGVPTGARRSISQNCWYAGSTSGKSVTGWENSFELDSSVKALPMVIYTKIHRHLHFLKVGWDHLSIFMQKHSKQILTSFPDHCIPFFWYFISWFKLCA